MQWIRTIVWVLIAVAVVLFAVNNDAPVTLTIWDNIVLDTKLYFVILGSFLLGLVPTWLLYRAQKWRLQRTINTMASAIEAQRPKAAPMVGSADQLDALSKETHPV